MKAPIYVTLALFLFAAGCSKKPHEEPTTEPSAAIAAPSAAESAAVPPSDSAATASADTDIEVPEDLAGDAEEEITPQNLDNELAALEKEIGSDT